MLVGLVPALTMWFLFCQCNFKWVCWKSNYDIITCMQCKYVMITCMYVLYKKATNSLLQDPSSHSPSSHPFEVASLQLKSLHCKRRLTDQSIQGSGTRTPFRSRTSSAPATSCASSLPWKPRWQEKQRSILNFTPGPQGWNLSLRRNVYPCVGVYTLYCLEEWRGEQRISPQGDNFT
jgi:hypothetical protein